MSVRGTSTVRPSASGIGLGDLRRLGDADREIALRHGHPADLHVVAHDDDAGALVDHDARGDVGLDRQLLDLAQQLRHAAADRPAAPARPRWSESTALRGRGAEPIVDGAGDRARRW